MHPHTHTQWREGLLCLFCFARDCCCEELEWGWEALTVLYYPRARPIWRSWGGFSTQPVKGVSATRWLAFTCYTWWWCNSEFLMVNLSSLIRLLVFFAYVDCLGLEFLPYLLFFLFKHFLCMKHLEPSLLACRSCPEGTSFRFTASSVKWP